MELCPYPALLPGGGGSGQGSLVHQWQLQPWQLRQSELALHWPWALPGSCSSQPSLGDNNHVIPPTQVRAPPAAPS